MYIQVATITGYTKELWYGVPATWDHPVVGSVVQVPLRNRTVPAIIVATFDQIPPDITFDIKYALSCEPFPQDATYISFIQLVSEYHHISYIHFITRIRKFISQKRRTKEKEKKKVEKNKNEVILTNEQKIACTYIFQQLETSSYQPIVLHGVTGSGKTECYKYAIEQVITNNKSALFLLPEVSLAVAFMQRLQDEMPHIPFFGFHSHTSTKEKKIIWDMLCNNKPLVIIGVHLPVLLPISNLGIIIVDEEHEVGYQEKKHPKIHTRDIALMRAQQYQIPIILGSATPSITTMHNIATRGWKQFRLTERFASSFPIITSVSLTEKKNRASFWISRQLQESIAARIAKKEQTIIFINRRGVSFFVQCKACSFIFSCDHCSVSLTLHESDVLTCHYCSIKKQLPKECPSCKIDEKSFFKKGIGTQQIVTILQKLFPAAVIARADMDTSMQKKEWKETIQRMYSGQIDILVGTQTITKGLHFPNVTLVGIVWADLNLHMPMYNASETTVQQLIQVAGRAGRSGKKSEVIMQTIGDYPILSFIDEQRYNEFCAKELEIRKKIAYPPFTRFAVVEVRHTKEHIATQEAHALYKAMETMIVSYDLPVTLLGPSKPPVYKIKNMYTFCVYAKSEHMKFLLLLYKAIACKQYKSTLLFTPNPLRM